MNLKTSVKELYKGVGAIRITLGFLSSHMTPNFPSILLIISDSTPFKKQIDSWQPRCSGSAGVNISILSVPITSFNIISKYAVSSTDFFRSRSIPAYIRYKVYDDLVH